MRAYRTSCVHAATDTVHQSTLMSKLTGTHSEASEIDFTTLTTVPGTVKVHGAPIQILDLRECLALLMVGGSGD